MIYFIREFGSGSDWVKIGVSQDPEKRLQSLQIGNPRELYIEGIIEVPGADGNPDLDYEVERQIHRILRHRGEIGEWFDVPPYITYTILEMNEAVIMPPKPDELLLLEEQGMSIASTTRQIKRELSTMPTSERQGVIKWFAERHPFIERMAKSFTKERIAAAAERAPAQWGEIQARDLAFFIFLWALEDERRMSTLLKLLEE